MPFGFQRPTSLTSSPERLHDIRGAIDFERPHDYNGATMTKRPTPTSIRLDAKIDTRLSALVPLLQASSYGELGVMSQSKTLRLAILRGLDVLEKELGQNKL